MIYGAMDFSGDLDETLQRADRADSSTTSGSFEVRVRIQSLGKEEQV
jgi:hypothetical protein